MKKDAISVVEASRIVLENLFSPQKERISLDSALGRVTSGAWLADQDYPSFDRVMMDGIAIRYSAWQAGIRTFRIAGIQRAGVPEFSIAQDSDCVEIMTGAPIPLGADTVVPYEMITIQDGQAHVEGEVRFGQNVHKKGTDIRKDDVIVAANSQIGMAETGIGASIGLEFPEVLKLPVITIISTGDELIDISMKPESYQIRRSNDRMLQSILRFEGIDAVLRHVHDNEDDVRSVLSEGLQSADVLLITGGVSKGKYDLLPEILRESGVEEVFHRVNQRPGKPFWFGKNNDTFVFAFPGNPVSAAVCAVRYFLPWLRTSLNQRYSPWIVKLNGEFATHQSLTLFTQVRIFQGQDGLLLAETVRGKGSGDFTQLTHADGFVEIPPSSNPASGLVQFYPYPGRRLL